MELKFDVDPSQLGESLKDILETLTSDQKKDIAKQVLVDWLKEPQDYERQLKEKEIINRLKSGMSQRHKSDDEIKQSYDFRQAMDSVKTTREEMFEMIVKQTVEYYKSLVKQLVEDDEKVHKVRDEILEKIKIDFPDAMHDAVTFLLAQQLGTLGHSVQQALMKSENSEKIINSITHQLNLTIY